MKIKLVFLAMCMYMVGAGDILQAQSDSTFIQMLNNRLVIIHYAKPGNTIYSISRDYGLAPAELKTFNGLTTDALNLNQPVYIPLNGSRLIRERKKGVSTIGCKPAYYKVKAGETLYRIAKGYFQMPIDTIRVRNRLVKTDLSLGQTIHIGWISPQDVEQAAPLNAIPTELGLVNTQLFNEYEDSKVNKKEYKQEGAAFWRKDDKVTSSTALFVLHNEAPKGSIVQVYNPRSKRTLYAKVTGKIPESKNTINVIVVCSPALAKALGAVDQKFYVQVKYLKDK